MDPLDVEKTTFQTPMGSLHYRVILLSLNNARTTYQCAIITTFHDMLHDYLEDYVDDIVMKSKEVLNYTDG